MSRTLIPIDTGRKQPYHLEITHHDVPMRGLPVALHGITFVHLSDLHGGYGNTEPVHEETVRRVHGLQPDLILLTGDYIDANPAMMRKDHPMEEMLCRLHAPMGIFASLGNHDHRRGPVGIRRRLERMGIHVLVNENTQIKGGLWIAGVDDIYEGKPDYQKALANVPNDATSLVLSHNPRLLEQIGDRDALILSGHTHGSQIALPFPSPKLICMVHLRCPQVAGWYQNGKARLYVNRGLGVTGKPFRYRCPAEIGVFRLLPQEE